MNFRILSFYRPREVGKIESINNKNSVYSSSPEFNVERWLSQHFLFYRVRPHVIDITHHLLPISIYILFANGLRKLSVPPGYFCVMDPFRPCRARSHLGSL